MKLTPQQKLRLMQTAKHVYHSYLALDFFKNKALSITNRSASQAQDSGELYPTLLDIVKRGILFSDTSTQKFHVAGKDYMLQIKPVHNGANSFIVQLNCAHQPSLSSRLPKDYTTDEQVCDLLANKLFTIELMAKDEIAVSLPLNEEHIIGGPKKYDLYRTHLVTLFNMINKIEHEDDISSLLIALATGSGKTYIQALWLGILALAQFNGIFAIPNNLISQFRKDLSRLLPESITNQIDILRDKDDPEQVSARLSRLNQPGNLLIASSKLILDNHYDQIMAASPDQTCLIFDEQHLLMANERRRMRLLTLSQHFLSVFLTATPNQETYQISGKKPVAIMSSGQKQKAGQGQFPEMNTIHCEFVNDKHNKQRAEGEGYAGFFRRMGEKFILRFDDAIQAGCSSAMRAIFDDLPYILKRKEESELRWRLQVPMASKILCIVDDNESLVNCCHYLQSDYYNENSGNVYHNGNFVERGSISTFFGIPDVDLTVLSQDRSQKKQHYLEQLSDNERAVLRPLIDSSLKQRLHSNMFHYLVEYVLSDISGQSLIEHNKLRKQSAEKFRELLVNRYQRRDTSYFYNKLSQEIDAEGALHISGLLADISQKLGNCIQRNQRADILSFTNNWFLDEQLFQKMGYQFEGSFRYYANTYMIMGVMSGMEEAETPVADSRPFLGLREDRYSLYEHSGTQVSRAKRRKRTSIELLNDQSQESSFTPNYQSNITEDIADNYFRLGFVGLYVSNKKTEGFSDPNLHTIINVTENSHDLNNSPAKLIQGIGRARGLDDTVLPSYIQGLGRNQPSSFDLNLLAKDDYYPELFQAQKDFEQSYIPILGEQVGKDIISWYHQHQDADESIDPDLLKKKVLHLVAAALRRLNIQNSHQIHISRRQLSKVIANAMTKLNQEIAHTQGPYQLSLFIRVVGTMINFVCECYFTILRFKPWIAMFWLSWELSKKTATQENLNGEERTAEERAFALRQAQTDALYLKILRQAHFNDLVAQGLIAAEFKTWLTRKTNAIQTIVEKSLLSYLKPTIKEQVDIHLNTCLFALLEKMVVPGKVELVREKLQQFSGIIHLIKTNEATLKTMQNDRSDEEFSELIVGILHKVPGLEGLNADDIVNYPRQAKEKISWFGQLSMSTLEQEPDLKEQVAIALTEFLQHEASSYLGGFFTHPDKIKLIAILETQPDKIRAFVDKYLAETIAQPQQDHDANTLFSKLRGFLELDDSIQLLPQKIERATTEIQNYQISCIAETIQSELLPSLVNLYPQLQREVLLTQITAPNIEILLNTQQESLKQALASNDPFAIANFFFSNLCENVPAQIDIESEKQNAASFFMQQTTGWTGFTNGMRYLTDRLTGSALGLVPGRIEKLLVTDPFFDSISLLLPYHHWKQLKERFKAEPARVKILAQSLSKYVDKNDNSLTPEILLQEINTAFESQYCSVQDYGLQVGQDLEKLGTGESTHSSSPALKAKLAALMRQEILPLLAVYLENEVFKRIFLTYTYTDEKLCEFFVQNFAEFKNLSQLNSEEQQIWVKSAIDKLHPSLLRNINNLIDPAKYAEDQANACQKAMEFKLKTVFGMSEVCKNNLKTFFNAADGQILQVALSKKEEAEQIMSIFSSEDGALDVSEQFAQVRASIPSLNAVYTLHERMDNFSSAMREYLNLGIAALDNNKLAELAAEQISPILLHPQFGTLINLYMGTLNEDELTLIFSARHVNDAAVVAKTLLRFKQLINKRNIHAFKQEFMSCDLSQSYEFERTGLKQVLDNFAIIAEEVTRAHGYYQQHDEKGRQDSYTVPPAFFVNLSETAKEIRVPAFSTFMSHFARKIFFIQGVRNGLPKAGQVYADSHKETIEALKNIKDNLLRPLWWTANSFSFVYHIIVKLTTILFQLQNVLYRLFTTIKQYLGAQPIVTQAHMNHVVLFDYNLSAFATAKIINDLKPLNREQVAAHNCPKDVIKHVERTISKLPGYRVRLFAQNRLNQAEELVVNNRYVPV